VDEIHSLFQSGMHFQGPFSQANEAFKAALGRGSIACIGCTTTAEYRHYIEPDGALDRRFEKIKLEQPSPEATRAILQARLPRLAGHYAPLHIPDEMLRRTVELTEEYLPGRYQPDKSIQLIDRACAVCVTATPPREEVTEDALFEALEATIGHGVVRAGELTEAGVLERLRAKIVGQDEALHAIASAFVGGLGTWKAPKGPRGRFVFCGPTGVGKTETAVLLARILGGGSKEALLRIDCNTLQGSGYDSGPALNRLIGVPPGYIGYARGEGGILSKIRDLPECIVLFDEIEKADPGVGEIILQILDEGRVEDADGNPLDFRRAFIVFTTNAGAIYDSAKAVGFEKPSGAARASPTADVESVMAALRASGHGEEFLGRHLRFFVFKALDDAAIRTVIGQQLAGLRQTAEVRGYQLDWDPTLVDYLASQWQPRFGVRHLTTILRHRIAEQLSVGEAQGELRGVSRIYLEPMRMEAGAERLEHSGLAARERRDGTLVIKLA
jgi:ATP-dependent Clp protease ATP-binding subunit ClpA